MEEGNWDWEQADTKDTLLGYSVATWLLMVDGTGVETFSGACFNYGDGPVEEATV